MDYEYIKKQIKLVTVLLKAKKQYYNDQLNLVKNDTRKAWNFMIKAINRTLGNPNIPKYIKVNNETITDVNHICNEFNSFLLLVEIWL